MKTLVAALVSAALIASTFIATAGPSISASAAGAAGGTVRGTVFQNYVSTGWSAPPAEGRPVAGVTATAYDAQGDIVGSGVSAADGDYAMSITNAYSRDLRVEFSNWDARFEPAFAAQGAAPSGVLEANDTSVQFVTLDASDSASDVDFGLIEPDKVTQPNAPIATAVQSAGGRTNNSAGMPAIVAQPWQLEGEQPASTDAISKVTTFNKIGSVWGMAYSPRSNDLFTAATLKRMSDLGPLGLGGIYRTKNILSPNGSVNAAAATAGWFNFSGLPVSNAGNVPLDIGASLVPANRALTSSGTPLREIPAFALAGRVGIGAIATSPDGSRLFATNLHDGHVYAVDISNPLVAPTSAYRIDTPVSATQAIWAVEVHEGQLYIGYVDTGDTSAGVPDPGNSAADKNMKAYVASTPIADVLDASVAAPAWTTALTVDLGYAKGSNIQNWQAESGKKFEAEFPQLKRWNSWTDTWSWTGRTAGTVGMKGFTFANNLHHYPQAILSSIAFDADGYLNLGFLDRTSVQSGNRSYGAVKTATDLWSTISDGDVLVAAPAAKWQAAGPGCPATAPSEGFVLECKGKVGDRTVRTTATTDPPAGQKPTFNDNEGPGGGEFFNDRRDLGTEKSAGAQNHNEIALGAVTSYPGSSEVATTAIDPRSQAYNTGLIWFDKRSGAASRGIDLVPGTGAGPGKTSFQKSGGLGGVALLAVSAPVEIGNRVWLDADLNGRQDADEPAINGAVVDLWTANAQGEPEFRIATRTTATVNGQPGTYYFRTDDADVIASKNAHPFVSDANYVLVFPSGNGAVTLAGPNAKNAGFAGLTWADLQRTTAQVRVASTAGNGGTSETNDSNPDVTTGRAPISVGGQGKNNHTYDAGWSAANNYELSKAFNPGTVSIPAGTSYTFNVVSAKNFRGEDRLASAGPGAPSDPQVLDAQMTLTAPNWTRPSTDALPLGYQLVLEEANSTAGSVTWSTPVAGNAARGQVTITPKRGVNASAQLKATNYLGSFEVVKTVTGTAAATVADNVKFELQYSLDGGSTTATGWVSKAVPFKLDALAVNTTVKFKESNPLMTSPALEGITWGTPAWTQVQGLTGPDAGGWYSYTLTAAKPNISLNLKNTADTTLGGFTILKARAAGELVPNQTFSFQYRVGAAGTPLTLGPIAAGGSVSTPNTIVYGSTVFVRELTSPELSNVSWAAPVWSGLPAGAVGPDADGWYSFVLKPNPAAPLTITVTNKAIPLYGQFTVKKTVEVTGTPDVDGKLFKFWYRTAPPVDGASPVFGAETAFELRADETWPGPGLLPVGTLVQVREEAPANEAGVSWRTPNWSLNGTSATVVDGWAQFAIVASQAGSAQALVANNHAEELYGLTLRKAFRGTGVHEVEGLDYPVEVQIGGGAVQSIVLTGNGDIWQGPSDLLSGTSVKVRELAPPVVPGIAWGAPSWTDGAGSLLPADGTGWVEFTISDDSTAAALTLTNAPSLLGQFQVKKTLVTSGHPTVPVNYTVEYTLDGGATKKTITLKADETSAVIDRLPLGTSVSVRELAPAARPDVAWATAWKINGTKAGADADGWVTFTITDKTMVAFEVTNTATELFGSFQVAKTVSGASGDLVPDDTKFWFSYTLGDGEPQSISATRAEASAEIGGLPHGTVVTIKEVTFPQIPGIKFNPKPGWKINGVAVPVDSPVTFTIDASQKQRVDLSVNNAAEPAYGRFKLTKAITGSGADRVPDNVSFSVEYSVDGGTKWFSVPAITKTNLTVSSPDILVGTHVLVREVAPADGVDFKWGNPQFTVNGTLQGASAEFTIDQEGAEAKVLGLNNPAISRDGTFLVQKSVGAPVKLTDPELANLTFTANWSGGGRSDTIALNAANNWRGGPSGARFPRGTQITLTEAAVTGLPASVQFDGFEWLGGVPGVTVSLDHHTATLIVDEGAPAVLQLRNDFTKLKGSFGVKKIVDGDFSLTDPELSGLSFAVRYSASDGTKGTLALDAAGNWQAAAGMFPTGTTVTLTEAAVTQGSLAPNVQWDGYEWLPNSDYTVSADGMTATFVVGNGTNAAFQLRNTFTELEGSFAVQKFVTGDFDLTDPELSGQSFVVAYTTSNGLNGTLDLNAQNAWFAAAGALPAGTEVTLTEVAPTSLAPHVRWDGYRWLANGGMELSKDGKTATLLVGADATPVRLEVENSFSELKNNFSVEKVVAGDFDLTAPELSGLSFTVPYTASNGADGTLSLNQAGHWTAKPGTQFPVGTVITVTEADVVGLPAYVTWSASQWLPGAGYTVSADGKSAAFTLDTTVIEPKLTLKNTFSTLVGGFTLTKKVTGAAAERVPDDLQFIAEYSLDGQTWTALPAVTKGSPFVTGPADVRLGTRVFIREVAPAAVPGVTWGAPAFSGVGITPASDGAPASFVVGSTATTTKVLLSNPTSPSNGQFQVTKKITGAGASLLKGDPRFTVKYSYDGQKTPGTFTIKAGQLASSEPIPTGTVVTLTEVLPEHGLVDGASWGTPVFVRSDGTVLQNGATITIGSDTVIALQLENPTRPELAHTGSDVLGLGVMLMTLLVGVGGWLLLIERRRRRYGPMRTGSIG